MEGYDILWFIAVPVGTAILGFLIAYGMMRNRSRTRAETMRTEQATHEIYKRADPELRRR